MSDMDEASWSQLPPDILQRVVSLLPLVPLFRCRVVCKQWNVWISELHPQPPAQRTEIFIVSNWHRVRDDQYWFALDTGINKWYKIDCRSWSNEPHIGVGCTPLASHKGVVLADVNIEEFAEMFVCDPVSRVRLGGISQLVLPNACYDIVADDNTRSYKVYMLSELKLLGSYHRMISQYNSNDQRWTKLCSVPELSNNCVANVHLMATFEEFVHVLVHFEPGPEELKFHSLLSYNTIENSWVELGWSEIPLFRRDDIRIIDMLMIRGQLLLVGARQAIRSSRNYSIRSYRSYPIRTNILVWEFSLEKKECVVIAEMPPSISTTVKSGELLVSGCGDRIFFLSRRTKMVTYCVLDDSWHCPPDLTARDRLPEFARCALFQKFMTLAVVR